MKRLKIILCRRPFFHSTPMAGTAKHVASITLKIIWHVTHAKLSVFRRIDKLDRQNGDEGYVSLLTLLTRQFVGVDKASNGDAQLEAL